MPKILRLMSNRGCRFWPFLFYSALLLLLWLASWFAGVAALFSSSDEGFNTLFSGEGMRWALCTAAASVDAAPWGALAMVVASAGLLVSSGVLTTIVGLFGRFPLTAVRRQAGLSALVVFVLFVALLFVSSVAPWNIFASVTGNWASSSLAQGWLLVLLVVSLSVSLMHGSLCGNYRTVGDVARGVSGMFALFAPAFLAVLPASGIVPCMQYIGLLAASEPVAALLSDFLCWMPFLFVACVEGLSALKRL